MKKLNDKEQQLYLVARFLMDEYNLQDHGLKLKRMKTMLGKYRYKTLTNEKFIQLSITALYRYGYRRLCNTILHEIAHALTPTHGHDRVWKEKAREIGAIPKARISQEELEREIGNR